MVTWVSTSQVPQTHKTTTERALNGSGYQTIKNLKKIRLADCKRLMHSKSIKNDVGAICWWDSGRVEISSLWEFSSSLCKDVW